MHFLTPWHRMEAREISARHELLTHLRSQQGTAGSCTARVRRCEKSVRPCAVVEVELTDPDVAFFTAPARDAVFVAVFGARCFF